MTGNVPDIFKVRRITPILLKNGSAYQPEIYRPIAVMSSFSKIFEKLLHDQLISFLEKHNILFEYQFDFRKGHSRQRACNARNYRQPQNYLGPKYVYMLCATTL